jgi:group II intron reverse transcriptase/maturase
MNTRFIHFTQRAQAEPRLKFNALMGLMCDPQGLHESFERQAGDKAPGVDGVRKADYAQDVEQHLATLSQRLRRLGYVPKPARRVYIPKGDSGRRPLGIPSFEDRIVQDRLSCILQALWEPEFRDCSFGFRPGRSAHQALQRLTQIVTQERTQWVVEADIKGFFNNVCHDHLMRFVQQRVGDPGVLRIIRRFLKAGFLEDGLVQQSERGTPQGGLVSPVLANIYLHYVLDLWFEKRYAKACNGKAYLVRYADDFVACFEDEQDAKGFVVELQERLMAFGLEVEPSKTATLRFGSLSPWGCRRDGRRRPQTFNFLGFTHYVTRSRSGSFAVGRKTQRERIRKKLKAAGQRLSRLRPAGGRAMIAYAWRHLEGHIQYYGISGNGRSVRCYAYQLARVLFQWLNRRSQRCSLNWQRYAALLPRLLPRPRIVHTLYAQPL